MRILLCISSLSTGGSERQLTLLASALRRNQHEVHVIYKLPGRFLTELQGAGVICHQLQTFSNYSPTIFPKFLFLVKVIRPDIIHSWLEMMDILSGTAAKLFHIPWIASERSAGLRRRNPIGRWRNTLARKALQVIANSEAGAEHLRQQGFKNLSVIPNAVLIPAPISTERPKHPLKLLCVSRLTSSKNYLTLFKALVQLEMSFDDFQLTIVGDGEERSLLIAEVERLNLQTRVLFVGEQLDPETYYRNASLFISLSQLEGQPNTVLEAASFYCPLLLSDISTHIETVTEGGALFCDGLDPGRVASVLQNFIAEDPALSKERAAIAFQAMSSKSPESIALRYENSYRAAITSHGR